MTIKPKWAVGKTATIESSMLAIMLQQATCVAPLAWWRTLPSFKVGQPPSPLSQPPRVHPALDLSVTYVRGGWWCLVSHYCSLYCTASVAALLSYNTLSLYWGTEGWITVISYYILRITDILSFYINDVSSSVTKCKEWPQCKISKRVS